MMLLLMMMMMSVSQLVGSHSLPAFSSGGKPDCTQDAAAFLPFMSLERYILENAAAAVVSSLSSLAETSLDGLLALAELLAIALYLLPQ